MSAMAIQALLPVIVLAGAVLVMLGIALTRRHGLTASLAALGLVATLAVMPAAAQVAPQDITGLMVLDGYALFYTALMVTAALAVTALSYGYFRDWPGRREEYYLLLLLATLGAIVLVASRHFATFLLGLELISVSLFALIAYPGLLARPLEAGVKYLVLSGVSSAFLVFGMALVYARLGALDFAALHASTAAPQSFVLVVGLALIVVGVGFKLSLVPFHMWTPDVFQGAPAPVTGFLATVSKGAVVAIVLRYFQVGDGYALGSVVFAIALIAIASILAGNLLALMQRDIKRLLAYSSIAHFGYVLIAFLAGGAFAVESVNFYLAAYFATTLAAFGVVTVVATDARRGAGGDLDEGDLEIYRGLLWRRPALAGLLALSLISLAGLPVSIGFVGKFYILAAGVEARSWVLVAALVVGSVIGLFYYLRIVAVLAAADGSETRSTHPLGWRHAPGYLVLLLLGAFIVGFGAYPSPIVDISRTTVGEQEGSWRSSAK
ncbi:MAG: NADH-quinone oxidoreductase subunit N [Geminicoccaceae bacterium]